MDVQTYKLLAMDTAAQVVMLIGSSSGNILAKSHYPAGLSPTDLAVSCDFKSAYIPMAGDNCYGAILSANLETLALTRLPLELPNPAQFSLSSDAKIAYFVDPGGTLYSLELAGLKLSPLGRPEERFLCRSYCNTDCLYSSWEHDTGGSIAILDHTRKLLI